MVKIQHWMSWELTSDGNKWNDGTILGGCHNFQKHEFNIDTIPLLVGRQSGNSFTTVTRRVKNKNQPNSFPFVEQCVFTSYGLYAQSSLYAALRRAGDNWWLECVWGEGRRSVTLNYNLFVDSVFDYPRRMTW